jgi:hypothetical protein
MKKKFVVETVNTFYEVHLVEAENEEEAQFIVQNSDYNASKWLGQQVANVSEFDERDLPRLRQVDSYFFEGVATIEDDYLVYKNMDGSPHGSMPTNKIR